LAELADIEGYRGDFLRLFGFAAQGVEYDQDVEPQVGLPSADVCRD